jgi:glycosyltransferase involved in cell wall biosynthesis
MIGFLIDRRKAFLTRHGMSYKHPVPELEKRRATRSLRLASGIVHDGEFIQTWLGVKPDICPNQGLYPKADDLTQVPEPSPTSAAYIGRLEPDSGIGTYIDAVRILTREKNRTFELHVYGDGTLMTQLRDEVTRDGLAVQFHGRTPDAQKHITDSCFAFIDGRMAMQEAMARRRLVVAAYPDPLKRDYVTGEPFSPHLVAAPDGAQLADRVVHYIEHPAERAALVERAFQHARTLTWERTAQAYTALWEERLLAPRRVISWPGSLRNAWRFAREAQAQARPA